SPAIGRSMQVVAVFLVSTAADQGLYQKRLSTAFTGHNTRELPRVALRSVQSRWRSRNGQRSAVGPAGLWGLRVPNSADYPRSGRASCQDYPRSTGTTGGRQ